MAQKCVIGIDGGGTKTHLLCTTLDKKVLCEVFGGSSNLCSNPQEQVEENLKELIQKCIYEIKEDVEIVSVCLGTAGLSCFHAEEILTNLLRRYTKCDNISIVGDMVIPLVAEIQDKPGLIIISGTGAISYGKNSLLNHHRSSGWGHVVGDEGSAYWIAVEGVRAALRSFDGRGEKTNLYSLLLKELDCQNMTQLINKIYGKGYGKKEIAKLSQVVNQAAIEGDQVAQNILLRAAEELFDTAQSVIHTLKLDHEKEFHVVLCGSVLLKNTYVNQRFKQLMEEKYKQMIMVNAQQDPVWGSITIALRSVKNG